MIKVEVLEDFTLGRFNEITNIERKSKELEGRLFTGDIFECKEDLADYLIKNNPLGRAFVKVIEVIPEEIKENAEDVKPIRRKRSVAKK